MQSKINISVVILTNNEAINIARCIKSVEWSNDILILDSGSCDETIKIARSFGARIIKKYFTEEVYKYKYVKEKVKRYV